VKQSAVLCDDLGARLQPERDGIEDDEAENRALGAGVLDDSGQHGLQGRSSSAHPFSASYPRQSYPRQVARLCHAGARSQGAGAFHRGEFPCCADEIPCCASKNSA